MLQIHVLLFYVLLFKKMYSKINSKPLHDIPSRGEKFKKYAVKISEEK